MIPNHGSSNQTIEDEKVAKNSQDEAEELTGKLSKDNREDKLMHTVLDVDKNEVDNAKKLTNAINNNISSFTPDFSFEKLVKDYKNAEELYGETMVREMTGYDPGFVGKNVKVPEFQRELKRRIEQNIERMKKEKLLDKDGFIREEAYELATLAMLDEELEKLKSEGYKGRVENKKRDSSGAVSDYRNYRRSDRYKDLSFKKTIHKAIRRGSKQVKEEHYVSKERSAKGKIDIVYCIDASGSMKGEKIKTAKKAGLALMHQAIQRNDKAGLIVFSSKIEEQKKPTKDFDELIKAISKLRTSGETDISLCLNTALDLFPNNKNTKKLVLITDGVQTLGKNPQEEVMNNISVLTDKKISLTIIGINLEKEGEELAKKITDMNKGKLYVVKDLESIDGIILEDYYHTKN